MDVINYLLGYKNLKIYQNEEMFKFSLDSILLANFVTLNKNITKILDIGCGNAVIPMILSTKTNASIDGIEIQKKSSELALKSIELNNLEDRINIINDDVKNYYKKCETETYDVIVSNPPYFKVHENSNQNDSEYKSIARHELFLNLEDLIIISKKLLKNKGKLAIVHRPERLLEIIDIMKKNNIEPKKICFVYPKKNKEANILLIEGVKNGLLGLKIMPPLYSHNEDGTYTEELNKYFS